MRRRVPSANTECLAVEAPPENASATVIGTAPGAGGNTPPPGRCAGSNFLGGSAGRWRPSSRGFAPPRGAWRRTGSTPPATSSSSSPSAWRPGLSLLPGPLHADVGGREPLPLHVLLAPAARLRDRARPASAEALAATAPADHRAVLLLAETRLYRVQPVRLFGIFPLLLLGSDYLALLSLHDVRRMDPRLTLPGRRKK